MSEPGQTRGREKVRNLHHKETDLSTSCGGDGARGGEPD